MEIPIVRDIALGLIDALLVYIPCLSPDKVRGVGLCRRLSIGDDVVDAPSHPLAGRTLVRRRAFADRPA